MDMDETTPQPQPTKHEHELKEQQQQPIIPPQYFVPFLPNLVTVFPSLSSSGKSHLVKRIVQNSKSYFTVPPSKVIFVLCNPKVEAFDESDFSNANLPVETIALQDFVPEECLQHNALLIFEDVQILCDKITNCINVYCHHLGLAGIFILVQGLLGRSKVFPLVTISHRIVLFLQSTAVSRLANYILQFYQDPELKVYIKTILAYAQRQEDIVLLEINKVRGNSQPFYVAIQGLDNFPMDDASLKRPVIYAQPNKLHAFNNMFAANYATLTSSSTAADKVDNTAAAAAPNNDDNENLPQGSFILVPAQNVTVSRRRESAINNDKNDDEIESDDKCAKTWNATLNIIKENLENNFPRKKLQLAENLVREIMRTQRFCVTKDGRTIMVKNMIKTKLPLLDLVSTITRQAGPREQMADEKFLPFVKILLENGAPLVYFKNKSLLQYKKQHLKRSHNKTTTKQPLGKKPSQGHSRATKAADKAAVSQQQNDKTIKNIYQQPPPPPYYYPYNNLQQQQLQQQQQSYHYNNNLQNYPSYFLDG